MRDLDPAVRAATDKIDLEAYLDREAIDYSHSYGSRGLQLILRECPFCGEGGGKTYVNAQTGLGNCFHGSCGAKFNKRKLIGQIAGLSGRVLDDHIVAVAQEFGWLPPRKRPQIKPGPLQLPDNMVSLPYQGRSLAYLLKRGVSDASCEAFALGYVHEGAWRYTLSDGMTRSVNYSRRVIIPILDLDGTLVSFQGRDTTGRQEPKYLFPAGYAVAGRHLYNANRFQDGRHTHLIVGEGAFDAIAIDQALQGDPGCVSMLAVATFGMHLSSGDDSQIGRFLKLKERGLRTVTLMWDGEGRALAQAVKSGLQLVGLGLQVRIATLPEGYDPAQGPDGQPTPPAMVRRAIFQARKLDRLSAVRLLSERRLYAV